MGRECIKRGRENKHLLSFCLKPVREHTGGWEDNIKMDLTYTHIVWKHVVWINDPE